MSVARKIATMAKILLPGLKKEINVPTGLFINNRFVDSVDSKQQIECAQYSNGVSPTSDHLVSFPELSIPLQRG